MRFLFGKRMMVALTVGCLLINGLEARTHRSPTSTPTTLPAEDAFATPKSVIHKPTATVHANDEDEDGVDAGSVNGVFGNLVVGKKKTRFNKQNTRAHNVQLSAVHGEQNGIAWTSDNNQTSELDIVAAPDFFDTNGRNLLLTKNIDTNQLLMSWFVLFSAFLISLIFHVVTLGMDADPLEYQLRITSDSKLSDDNISLKNIVHYIRAWSYIPTLALACCWFFCCIVQFENDNAFFWSFFAASCMSILTSMVRIIFPGGYYTWSHLVFTLCLWITFAAFVVAMVYATINTIWLVGLTIGYTCLLLIQACTELAVVLYVSAKVPIGSNGSDFDDTPSCPTCVCFYRLYSCFLQPSKRKRKRG